MRKSLTTCALLAGLLSLGVASHAQDDFDSFADVDLGFDVNFVDEGVATSEADTPTDDSISIDFDEAGRSIQIDASSVEDLQRLLNLPASGQLREYQEDLNNPRAIFSTDADVIRILGDKPDFIYFPEGVDPMIIPWVRERIASQEMWQEARLAFTNRDFEKAINLLRDLRERFPGTEAGQQAPAEIERIIREREIANAPRISRDPADIAPPQVDEEPVLPDWVKRNTTGVMIGERPMVIVGNDFLMEGDSVPRFASVRVKSISASEVVYVYQEKDFVVEVVGTF